MRGNSYVIFSCGAEFSPMMESGTKVSKVYFHRVCVTAKSGHVIVDAEAFGYGEDVTGVFVRYSGRVLSLPKG
jgi:hypothetical protein